MKQLTPLLRRPAFVVSVLVVIVVAVVWLATSVAESRPKTLDDRVHDVASQIQCPNCGPGESIADSSALQAEQMRAVVREQLAEGKSEDEVLAYFRERYGESVLMSPPFDGFTVVIWLAPILMLLAGAVAIWSFARQMSAARLVGEGAASTDGDTDEVEAGGALTEAERDALARRLRRELDAEDGLPMPFGKEGR